MNTPMISVVMPVYNGEKYLNEAIDSILHQTYTDFEFIILNDGSTDRTEEIILSYDDPRIVYVKNEENLQIVKTLNKGIALAKGKYIARMDADDISLPERFKKQVEFMEENPDIDVCGTWVKTIGYNVEQWQYPVGHEQIKSYLLFDSALAHPSVIFRSTVFEHINYEEAYNKAEDYALWVELSKEHTLHNLPLYLLQYRLHPGQTESTRQFEVANMVRKKMLNNLNCSLKTDQIKSFTNIVLGKAVEIDKMDDVFTVILEANNRTIFIDDKTLKIIIEEKFWHNLLINVKCNAKVFYKNGSILKKYSMRKYFKSFFKCIIGYKNDK
ncbi:glycosyltransferase family 2 protein [Sulfurovum lithotrophicum]|uniref:glycosyltransferase family 2 protein n=1 Tax=Sulfurovum lithotrophicum TaxID=206403 RepID=UPI000697D1D9|nr:glycosyltransferase family 2 protein [Sulfurovum lithotrophicum]